MRTYAQYCAVAHSLDLVGERWTLLIVRELLALGDARYSDVAAGIPGIPPAQLSDRLRALEERGIVERRESASGRIYALTEWGRGLEAVLIALGRWAGPTLAMRRPGERFQAHWLTVPLRAHLRDRTPDAAPVRLAIEVGDERLVASIAGDVIVSDADHGPADATLRGDAGSVVRTIAGIRAPGQPGAAALTGDPAVFARVAPSD